MLYEYKCIIKRIIDGDTVDVDIDLGFETWLMNKRVRIVHIDAPETRTRDLEEKAAGLEAAAFVESLLPVGSKQILISKEYNGKYSRLIGDFLVNDSDTLSSVMLKEGHAVYYK